MSPLTRRPRPPAEIRAKVGQKMVAAAPLADGGWLALTRDAVVVLDHPAAMNRPWHEVEAGTWNSDDRLIRLTWVDGSPATDLVLAREDRDLAAVLRERVEASLVHLQMEQLPGGAMLRGAIRRGADGALFSQVSVSGVVGSGVDLQERARLLEAKIRDQVGLPR